MGQTDRLTQRVIDSDSGGTIPAWRGGRRHSIKTLDMAQCPRDENDKSVDTISSD